MEAAGSALKIDPCLAGSTRDQPNREPACMGTSSGRLSVALWGDSHSAALAPGLRSLAAAQGYGFVQLGKASCPPLLGATHFIPRLPLLGAGCQRFNRRALQMLQDGQSIRVVVLTAASAPLERTWQNGWLVADPAQPAQIPAPDANRRLFLDALTATIRALQAAGKQVIVIQDVPSFEIDPLWRVRTARIPARRTLAAWLGVQDAADPGFAPPDPNPNRTLAASLVSQAVAALPGVELVDPIPALCSSPTQCAYRSQDNLLYGDSSHLSPEGALYALRNFRLPANASDAAQRRLAPPAPTR
jgi:hypothetical protein